jgi:hypothetical protein
MQLKLAGKEFQTVSRGTIEWDVEIYRSLQGAGLSDITLHLGETPEQLAQRIFRSVMASGSAFEILGCVLVPAGMDPLDWTPSLQRETAAFIRRLNSDEDKAAINGQIVSLIASFFRQGLLSVKTFPRLSDESDAVEDRGSSPSPSQDPAAIPSSANGQ